MNKRTNQLRDYQAEAGEVVDDFDDDVFQYTNSEMRQCISNFGRQLAENIAEFIITPTEDDPEYDEDYDPTNHLKWGVGELVRWCRSLNRQKHEAEQRITALEYDATRRTKFPPQFKGDDKIDITGGVPPEDYVRSLRDGSESE